MLGGSRVGISPVPLWKDRHAYELIVYAKGSFCETGTKRQEIKRQEMEDEHLCVRGTGHRTGGLN